MAETSMDATPSADMDRVQFVNAMRRIPGAVAIVATGQPGDRRGLAATAWCSLSADPPTILVCVNQNASAHGSILDAAAFSLNLVPDSHAETVAIFSAQRGRHGEARFTGEDDWSIGPSGLPLLVGAIASFECVLDQAHVYGSHTILIGRVAHLAIAEEGDALLYVNGYFARATALG